MHLLKRRGGCAAGLGSRGECVVDGLFSLPYKDPKDTSFSLEMDVVDKQFKISRP